MSKKTYQDFIEKHPEWDNTEYKNSIVRDIEFIQLYRQKESQIFDLFLNWQHELLSIIEIDTNYLDNLLNVLFDNGEIPNYKSSKPVCISLKNAENFVKQVVDIHVKLFSEIEEASSIQNKNHFERDLTFLVWYLKNSDEESLIKVFEWQQNLLEAIGIDKLSLTRFLISISLVLPEDEKAILKRVINQFIHLDSNENIKDNLIQELIVDTHILLFSEIDNHSGLEARDQMLNDLSKHIAFLNQAEQAQSEIIFVEYCKWLKSTLNGLNIETISIIRFFVSMRTYLKTQSPHLIPYLDAGIQSLIEQKEIKVEHESFITNENAEKYLNFILSGARQEATNFILELADGGHPIKSIYLDIFQNTQYEIGRLWENNKISVAQEHYCTATTQLIMSLLYPRFMSSNENGKNVITTCVGSELHEMGIRMVSDFLEMDGWNTYYLGANAPLPAISASIIDNQADLLALSVTLSPHISNAKTIIQTIKQQHPDLKVIVGGYPFIQDDKLGNSIGADAVIKSAINVHEECLKLFDQ